MHALDLVAFAEPKRRAASIAVVIVATMHAALAWAHADAQSARSDTIVRLARTARHPSGGILAKELSIGDATGADEYSFYSINDVLPAKDGYIWIVDLQSPTSGRGGGGALRQYDARGKYVRTVGRTGQGPGEYAAPSGLAQLADGRVVLRDVRNNRINVYTLDGKFDTTWTFMTLHSGSSSGGGLHVDAAGVVWMEFGSPGSNEPTRFLRLLSTGRIVDTVMRPKLADLPRPAATTTASGRTIAAVAPYYPVALSAWTSPGFFATATTSSYAIDLRAVPGGRVGAAGTTSLWRAGDPVVSVRRAVTAVPVTEIERNDQRAYLTEFVNYAERQFRTKLTGSIPEIPRVKPMLAGLDIGEDGRLWVRVSMPSERFTPPSLDIRPGQTPHPVIAWREPIVYDVFESDGTYLGRVPLPPNVRPKLFSGDDVWCVVEDAGGVKTVAKYRVRWR